MAITIQEIESMLDEIGYNYERNDNDDIILIFNAENYLNYRNEANFVIVIQLSEAGEFIKFFHPMAYQVVDPDSKLAALESFAYLSWRLKMVDFEYDPSDGEIRPTLDFPIEDGTLTLRQLQRSVTIIPRILDQFHDTIVQIIDNKEFDEDLFDSKISDDLQKGSTDTDSDDADEISDENLDIGSLREQIHSLTELLESIDETDNDEIEDDTAAKTINSEDELSENDPDDDDDDNDDDFEFV